MNTNVYTFHLPDLGEGVMEGEIIEWLKQVGDTVKQDEPVVTVMTDKATVELPSPYPGKIKKHYYKPGEIAVKDRPLYDIELLEGLPQTSEKTETTHVSKQIKQDTNTQTTLPATHSANDSATAMRKPKESKKIKHESVKATPKIRHEAKEWGIDLKQVTGTGQEGRITEEDLHNALPLHQPIHLEEAPTRFPGDQEQPLVGVRGLMAKKMHHTHIPQFSYFEQTDATRLIQLRNNLKGEAIKEGINLSYMPFFIRALSLTMKRFPQINASLDMQDRKVILHQPHHIGIAIATAQGLIVPVLKEIQTMSLSQVINAYETLKSRAISGKLSPDDMKEATITISNFGVLDGDALWATPMISSPQVAIIAIAKMRKMPLVKEEHVVIRDVVPISWSFDHRLIDGEMAATVSHYYSALLKEPASLL